MILRSPKLYCAENVQRARYAQIAVAVLALAVSGYLVTSTFTGIREVWSAQRQLKQEKMETGKLSREVSAMKREQAKQPRAVACGVEAFAVKFSQWANERNVKVESLMPDGMPVETAVKVDDADLGTWNAIKVRVEGSGDFQRLVSLLDQLRSPGMPVQLESFSLQSSPSSGADNVSFELMLTVYEKKSGTT